MKYSSITTKLIAHIFATHEFTEREREVFPLLLAKCSDEEIAEHRSITVKAANNIVHRMIRKMNLDGGRAAFFAYMFEELDSVVLAEDALVEEEKRKRGVNV